MVADDGALGGLPEEDGVGPDYECRYEDEYDGVFYGSFGALLSSFEEYAEGDVAHLNVPVWVEHVTDHEEPPFVALGMMLTRKGECRIWKAPATAAQA